MRLTLPRCRRVRGRFAVPGPAAATGFHSHQPRMVPVMRFKIAMVALLSGITAGLGCCHHIAGKNDCGYNPSDYPIGPPTPPYPSTLAPSVPASKDKVPDQIPRTTSGSTEKSMEAGTPIPESGN